MAARNQGYLNAITLGYLDVNPLKQIKHPKPSENPVRFLTRDEKDILEKALDRLPNLRPIVFLAMFTGARRGNVVMLRWEQVDLTHKLIRLPKTKNRKPLDIPLNEPALAVLNSIPRVAERVFPGLTGPQVGNALRRVAHRTGVKNFHFHDLRDTFGSYLAMAGVHPKTIQKLMGHQSLRMTEKYMDLANQYSRDAVDRLGEIFGI